MRLENILPRLRTGEKARIDDGSGCDAWFYGKWIACRVGLPEVVDGVMTQPKSDDMWLSLVCLDEDDHAITGRDAWGMPLWMVMSDRWEIVE